jgi:hypothetical protein
VKSRFLVYSVIAYLTCDFVRILCLFCKHVRVFCFFVFVFGLINSTTFFSEFLFVCMFLKFNIFWFMFS